MKSFHTALGSVRRLMPGVLVALFVSFPLLAQYGSGTLNGMVMDSTGASVPDAVLTLINVETNVKRTAKADGRGHYSVPEVPIGRYTLQAQAQGFGQANKDGIVMAVGAQLTVDLSMPVGGVNSTVTVTTDVQNQVNSTSGEQSTLIDPKQIRDLRARLA